MAESSDKAACDHSGDAVNSADSGVEKLGDKGDTHEGATTAGLALNQPRMPTMILSGIDRLAYMAG